MVDGQSSKKNGTTIVSSEDAFQPIRPKFKPTNNPTAIAATTPVVKRARVYKSTAQYVREILADSKKDRNPDKE